MVSFRLHPKTGRFFQNSHCSYQNFFKNTRIVFPTAKHFHRECDKDEARVGRKNITKFVRDTEQEKQTRVSTVITLYKFGSEPWWAKGGSCHKRQKPQAPTPQAPIRNHQTTKGANAKVRNHQPYLTYIMMGLPGGIR